MLWLFLVIFRDNAPICSWHWDNSIDSENQICFLFSPLFLFSFQFKLGSWVPPVCMMKWRVMFYFAPERNTVKLLQAMVPIISKAYGWNQGRILPKSRWRSISLSVLTSNTCSENVPFYHPNFSQVLSDYFVLYSSLNDDGSVSVKVRSVQVFFSWRGQNSIWKVFSWICNPLLRV